MNEMRTEFEIRLTEHLESALGMVSEARKQNALLREALEASPEWVWEKAYEGYYCPVCGQAKKYGHEPNCLRQKALGKKVSEE